PRIGGRDRARARDDHAPVQRDADSGHGRALGRGRRSVRRRGNNRSDDDRDQSAQPFAGADDATPAPAPSPAAPPRLPSPPALACGDALPVPAPCQLVSPEARVPTVIRPDQVRRVAGEIPPLEDRLDTPRLTVKLCIDTAGAVTSIRFLDELPASARNTIA